MVDKVEKFQVDDTFYETEINKDFQSEKDDR